MSTNQEKSFIATMTTSAGNLHLPYLTYGQKTHITRLDYEAFTLEQFKDISSYLCVKPDPPPTLLKFYFRCIDDYYSIYTLNKGPYYYRALSNEDKDFIAVYPHDDDQTTFNLLDTNGSIITLDQLDNDSATLRIQTRGGHSLRARAGRYPTAADKSKVTGLVCTGKKGGTLLNFKLNILQRNVPY